MILRIFFIYLLTLGLLPSAVQAAPAVHSIQDLKALQTKIRKVTQKVLPATVSIFSEKNKASGSGVIVSPDGLILTAGHVVNGTEKMTVIFPNGKQAQAKVLGANYTKDSAMLQIIDPGPWPYASLGESKNLKTGDLVIAMGHAGGFDPVRTAPVRFGRVISTDNKGFINTDCALIGGDSGGPLFDLEGRVIGINSSIGYSLSINNHTGISNFLKDWGKLKEGESWGSLGENPLDNPDRPILGILTLQSRNGGILVQHVIKGGPAFKAGLRRGDIIRSVDGKHVRNLRRLNAIVMQYQPGDTIKISFIRGGYPQARQLTLGRRANLSQ